MKFRLIGPFALCCAFAIVLPSRLETAHSQTKNITPTLSQSEQDLLNEINQARAYPQVYAGYLEKLKPQFKGKLYTRAGQETGVETQEGWDAVDDAIKFMRAAKPVAPLNTSQGLCLAAISHVKDQSATGATGHSGSDNTMIEQRVKPFGSWSGDIGENLVYGSESARERIIAWLIDDGVSSRGHRKRIMSQDYRVAGVSCGPHPEYGAMCVLTLASAFSDSSTAPTQRNAAKPSKVVDNGSPQATLSATAPSTNSNGSAVKSSSGASANAKKSPK